MHLLKFPSHRRQSILPCPIGASRWSNGFSQQQRHAATDANNQRKQGGCSKLEKGMLTICSQMWALTWKFMVEKLGGWEIMKDLMSKVDWGQIGMRKSLVKRKLEITPFLLRRKKKKQEKKGKVVWFQSVQFLPQAFMSAQSSAQNCRT